MIIELHVGLGLHDLPQLGVSSITLLWRPPLCSSISSTDDPGSQQECNTPYPKYTKNKFLKKKTEGATNVTIDGLKLDPRSVLYNHWWDRKLPKIWAKENSLSVGRRTDLQSLGQTTVRSPWPSINNPFTHSLTRATWPARFVGGPTIRKSYRRWEISRQLRGNAVGSTSYGHKS